MKKTLFVLTLATIASPALAEFPVGKVGVMLSPKTDLEIGNGDADGTALGAYAEVGSTSLFAYASLNRADLDTRGVDIDVDESRLGFGARSIQDKVELSLRVERYDIEIDVAGGAGDDDGVGVHLGGAFELTGNAALFGSVGMLSLSDSDGTEFELGVRGKITDSAELYGAWRSLTLEDDATNTDTDLTDLRLGVNLLF